MALTAGRSKQISETEALKKAILTGQDFTRSPIVQGGTTADHPLIEDTYIEVDLVNQHMSYYQDGKVALETDIVSGKPYTYTCWGLLGIKKKNATLKGTNGNGTPCGSPVNYWMPIDWTGVGIHDSGWQSEYGGDLWKTRGSHRCINTPPSVMKDIFGMVKKEHLYWSSDKKEFIKRTHLYEYVQVHYYLLSQLCTCLHFGSSNDF